MTEPSPTPAPPTSAAAVAEQLKLDADDAAVQARLAPIVAAVNEFVTGAATSGPASRALGATMLGARLYRRRSSPEGTGTYTAEGVASAARSDPEVWMLLGLGSWAPPVVG